MPRTWTEEQKQQQAERCRRQKPWKHSTGPRTPQGKTRSSLNSLKHGDRCRTWRHYGRMFRLNREFIKHSILAMKTEQMIRDFMLGQRTDNPEEEI